MLVVNLLNLSLSLNARFPGQWMIRGKNFSVGRKKVIKQYARPVPTFVTM